MRSWAFSRIISDAKKKIWVALDTNITAMSIFCMGRSHNSAAFGQAFFEQRWSEASFLLRGGFCCDTIYLSLCS